MSAITVENLSKKYIIRQQARQDTLRDALSHGFKNIFNRFRRGAGESEDFWALRDLNFSINSGEVVGIVGGNGAGKSTLLKVLSRITEPTTGTIKLKGRVASLLEVGTGFHPELSGKENIFLNGAILGMSRWEILQRFDEIVQFAEVERFLDTPVKRYSSGMYVRLAFAVAAHLEPEILIVDEVLAVGDLQFQTKCLNRMQEVSQSGRTVLFVSHNPSAIRALCKRALVLESGKVILDGPVESTMPKYLSRVNSRLDESGIIKWPQEKAPQCADLRLDSISLTDSSGVINSKFSHKNQINIEIKFTCLKDLNGMRFVVAIKTTDGTIAFSSTSENLTKSLNIGPYTISTVIPENLLNTNRYIVNVHTGIPNRHELVPSKDYLSFEVDDFAQAGEMPHQRCAGIVAPQLEWRIHSDP